MTRPFTIDPAWAALVDDLNVRPADLLRSAGLPEDLFRRERPTVSAEGLDRLFSALSTVVEGGAPGLVVGQAVSLEVFSLARFAANCCENLIAATERLTYFKPLAGPVRLESHMLAGGLELAISADPGVTLPQEYVAAELVFLVNLGRTATRHPIRPVAIEMVSPPVHPGYAEFFGHEIYAGPFNRVVLSPVDARRPFLSANPAMFDVFEPGLRVRLDELDPSATTGDRVRSVLMEALPSGQPDVGTVAKRLGSSPRTLQRRLGAEGTSFQNVLQELRARLARHYLSTTPHTSGEIAYLLGYDDPNSFTRAFHTWTGTTPETFRAAPTG